MIVDGIKIVQGRQETKNSPDANSLKKVNYPDLPMIHFASTTSPDFFLSPIAISDRA
jgi:hypothetical protein